MLERSIRENWEEPALTDYVSGFTYNYKDIAAAIEKMHILYREMGIKPDDKIALVGKNTPEWGIVFLSAVSYGAIIVPILQNFPVDDIHHIVNHSEYIGISPKFTFPADLSTNKTTAATSQPASFTRLIVS